MKSILTTGALAALTLVPAVSLLAPAAHAGNFTVTTDSDADDETDGECSLREAMQAARVSPPMPPDHNECIHKESPDPPHFINFSDSFTITVGSTLPNVGNDVRLVGLGQTSTIIDGNDANTPFNVDEGDLLLFNLTVQNGSGGSGGAVSVDDDNGSLTANIVTFKDNSADLGGAIHSVGDLHLAGATFVGNASTGMSFSDGGGAISFSGAAASMTLTGVDFMSNSAANRGGAIAVTSLEGPINTPPDPTDPDERHVLIAGALFLNNSADGDDALDGGGAIWAHTEDDAHFSILDTVFKSNSAAHGGGGAILLDLDSRIAYFDPMVPSFGGIFASHFEGNSAGGSGNDGIGGAIFTRGELTVVSSSFAGNESEESSGGAIGHNGGSSSGALTVANVTFSEDALGTLPGNTAAQNGGAIAQINSSGQVEVINSTFSDNAATNGSGGAIFNANADDFEVANSILANSAAGGNCGGGAIADLGGNVQFPNDDDSCGTGIPMGDPLLDALFLNTCPDGPCPNLLVLTMSLGQDSAALGAGDPVICTAGPIIDLDARGVARPDGDPVCDSGAYESDFLGEPTEPILSFDPSSLDFGGVEVGTTSPPMPSTLTNTGDADATGVVFSGLPNSGFAADTTDCGTTLPAGQDCLVSVTFTPSATGPANATLTVDSDEGATADLNLEGNGVAQPLPVLTFDPSSLDFGDVEVGTTSPPLTATLENSGTAPATGLDFSAPGSGFVADVTNCGTTLPDGQTCLVSVTFTPPAPGSATATLMVDSDEGATAVLSLEGNGVTQPLPVLTFDPSSLDFGDVEAGTTSPPLTATLENSGAADATGLDFSAPGSGFAADTTDCGTTLPAGQDCLVSVTFTPSATGPANATLTVDSDEGATADLNLEGNGVAQPLPVLTFDPSSLDFGDVEVGTTSPPLTATLENSGTVAATGLGFSTPGSGFAADTADCGTSLPAGQDCLVSVTFTPSATGPANATLTVDSDEGPTANLDLSGEGVPGPGGVPTPEALDVDGTPIASDGNGVFEPSEQVEVAPAWLNNNSAPLSLTGAASDFTGPAGAVYGLVTDAADYGTLDPGASASCLDTGVCYAVEVDDPATRPALHWNATVLETLSDPDTTTKTWTLHIGESFADVPPTALFYRFVETMVHHGMASDCGGGNFCPDLPETRDMMAMAVLTGLEGGGYQPLDCVDGAEVFADVPFDDPFCPWIEELSDRGVILGCGGGNYCPTSPVTRAQMAVFLLKTLEGASYTPPACSGLFDDVACPSPFADWIEDLFGRGITAGCGTSPLRYCPGGSITRGQCAAFQSKNFDLPLYEP